MFVDASALVAIFARKKDSESLRLKLNAGVRRIISPIAVFEASLAMQRLRDISPADAFELFGKGRHKASLNMGDCFAYACAKLHKVPLLCKGDGFIHTDIDLA